MYVDGYKYIYIYIYIYIQLFTYTFTHSRMLFDRAVSIFVMFGATKSLCFESIYLVLPQVTPAEYLFFRVAGFEKKERFGVL